MERGTTQESELGSAGWISMCDAYLLFSALAIALCLAVGAVAQQLGLEKRDGDRLIASLQGKVESLTAERHALQKVLTDSESAGEHVPALRQQVNTLKAEIASLRGLERRAQETEGALNRAEQELGEARTEAERLRQDLETAARQQAEEERARNVAVKALQEREAELTKARTDLADARSARAQAERRATELAQNERAREHREGQIRQELLGLKGPLNRVVFLFDRSDSMRKNDRWGDAKETMRLWLEYLPVKEAAIVLFSSDVVMHPNDGQLMRVDDEGRQRFVEILSGVNPGGTTNTLGAIRRAYQYPDVDALILFTDGEPNSTRESLSSSSKRDIYRFIDSQRATRPNLRIHTIGVGDYFSSSMRDFLLKVANMTDGSFLGR